MHLIYLANLRMPSERAHAAQIVNMCNAFASVADIVTLFVPYRTTVISESLEEYYGQKIQFNVIRIKTLEILRYGALAYFFSTSYFALLFLLRHRLSTQDVVFSRDEMILWVVSFFIKPDLLVWESHEAKYNFAAKRLLKKGVPIVAISEGIRDFYLQKGVDAKQLLVAHDAVDDSFFGEVESREVSRKRLGLEAIQEPIVMYIGGLDAWKGIETFLEASVLCTKVVFVVIGGKKEEVDMYKKKNPKVLFLGARPYKELKDNQQAADILVIPNTATSDLSAKYTSPLKLFAHMTSKIPIVASRVPSITSVLNDDEAFFFEPDNSKSLSDTIVKVRDNYADAIRSALVTYNKSKQYTWNERSNRIVKLIRTGGQFSQ